MSQSIKIPTNQADFIAHFAQVCHDIAELADEIGETHWASNFFRQAYMALSNDSLPAARRLKIALNKTHVFGGMGSWNDSPPFSAQLHGRCARYDELTEALWQCRQMAMKEDWAD